MTKITTEEHLTFLTDRWGDWNDSRKPDGNETEHRAAIERLLPAMFDEFTFIGRKDGEYGIIFESEWDDGIEALQRDHEGADQVQARHPDVDVHFTHGSHIFNGRWAARAFIPERLATAQYVQQVSTELLKATFGMDIPENA